MAPHAGLHVCCPVCEGPIPDLLGELTDELAGILTGTRATDCYYCGTPLVCPALGILLVGPSDPPPARRTAARRDLKFGDASGVDAGEQALSKRFTMRRTIRTAIPACPSSRGRRWSTNSASVHLRDMYGDNHGYQWPHGCRGSLPAGPALGRGSFAARPRHACGLGTRVVAPALSGSGQSSVAEFARRGTRPCSERSFPGSRVALA